MSYNFIWQLYFIKTEIKTKQKPKLYSCAVRKTKMKLGVAAVLKELAKEKKKKKTGTNCWEKRTKDFRGSKDCFLLGKEETKETSWKK